MGIKSAFFFCILIIFQSCHHTFDRQLPGFDFELFKDTPVEKLARAVEKDDMAKINEILATPVELDYKELKFGHTLLMVAVANNKINAVETLLKSGASPNLTSKSNSNAVTIAAENYSDICDTTIIYMLQKSGGDLNFIQTIDRIESNGMRSFVQRTVLMIAARNDCFAISKYIIDNGANINEFTYYNGYGALTEALIQDNLRLAKYLIIDRHVIIPPYIFKRQADISYKGEPTNFFNSSGFA